MRPVIVNIELPPSIRPKIEWSWDLFCSHFRIPYRIDRSNIGDLLISTEAEGKGDIHVSQRTQDILEQGELHHEKVFPEEPVIRDREGNKDILGTAFYMVNSLQEHGARRSEFDHLGRFPYRSSYQARFEVPERDLVSELFEELINTLEQQLGDIPEPPPTRCFLTHDVDRIRQGNIREGYHRLKNGRLGQALISAWKYLRGDHEWNNIRSILEFHQRFGYRSSFFWLSEKGRDAQGVLNADYDIKKPRYRQLMKEVKESGSTNGLHKSTFSKGYTEEFVKLDHAAPMNRDHYLKIELPAHYQHLEDAGFLLDSSLGFSDRIGHRNNYGRPFHPYDARSRKGMELLEVPLNLMDVTLFRDQKAPYEEASRFLQQARTGSVLTILWHNNAITDGRFASWKEVYKALLRSLNDRGIDSIGPEELIEQYPTSFAS